MITPPSSARPLTTGIYPIIAKEAGKIVLTPVPVTPADDVRKKLASLGVTEADVDDAIAWARAH